MNKISEYQNNTENFINEQKHKINSQIGLLEIEENITKWLNKLGTLMLQEIIDNVQEPTTEQIIFKDGKKYRYNKDSNLTLKNRFGELIHFHRRYYCLIKNGVVNKKNGFAPKDEKLGLCEGSKFTPDLAYLCNYLGSQKGYESSSDVLKEMLLIDVSSTGVQKNVERFGNSIKANPEDLVSIHEAENECELMVASADATGCPRISDNPIKESGRASLSNPTECKMCTVSKIEKYFQTPASREKADTPYPKADKAITGACFGDNGFDEVRDYIRRMGLYSGQLKAKKLIFLGDGAKSNWGIKDDYFPDAVEILDSAHAFSHLASFCKYFSIYKDTEGLPKEYFIWKKNILDGEIYHVIEEMENALQNKIKIGFKEQAQKDLNYISENKDRMHYDEYLDAGYPIGSGTIESACKQVVSNRFKKQGMRWRKNDSQSVLNVRLHLLNGTLKRFFESKLKSWRLVA